MTAAERWRALRPRVRRETIGALAVSAQGLRDAAHRREATGDADGAGLLRAFAEEAER